MLVVSVTNSGAYLLNFTTCLQEKISSDFHHSQMLSECQPCSPSETDLNAMQHGSACHWRPLTESW